MFDAMEPIGLDTLKATRTLQAAGFDAAQAETLVSVLGGPVSGNVATREDLRDLRSELKEDIASCRSELKAEIGQLRKEMRSEMADVRSGMADFRREMGEMRREMAEIRLEGIANFKGLKAQMYSLLLVQATVIVGLILGLQQLLPS